jgi:hypothetical protein
MSCSAGEREDGNSDCCTHHLLRPDRGNDLVCCWCGDLYVDEGPSRTEDHGAYLPEPIKDPLSVRAQALEEAANQAEAFLHIVTSEEEQQVTPAAYSNGTVRRIAASIRALAKEGA